LIIRDLLGGAPASPDSDALVITKEERGMGEAGMVR
jgi:hypothetical protein